MRLGPVFAIVLFAALGACNGGGTSKTQDDLHLTLPDEDGDTIMDFQEGVETDSFYDFDGDGTPNYQDTDSDDDGILDSVEAGDDDPITYPVDTDLDGMPDFLDLDADGNCLDDAVEGSADADNDGLLDFTDVDDDEDGILDTIEIGDACAFPDSDGDGTPDYHDADSDDDGIADVYEAGTTAFNPEPVDTDLDGIPDYLDADSDGDGTPDSVERGDNQIFEPPLDTDGDGIGDYADTDSDNDGISDATEATLGTDPRSDDSDGDGFTDGAEVAVGTNPLDPTSVIDGIYVEVPARTDVDEPFEFTLSIDQGDISFLLDTTCSMQGTLNAMKGEFAQLVTDISASIPDSEYGVATFDDYNFPGMGTGPDLPFTLEQQVTNDQALVQSVLNGLALDNGGDIKESSTEAVYQALSGAGYDQNCDGGFNANTDVRPFIASASDPFGGVAGGTYNAYTAGLGSLGGMGFRDHSLPILVYATDAAMRNASTDKTPGGCPGDADGIAIKDATKTLGAYLIGVSVNGSGPLAQMNDIADATHSYADVDGDGAADDRLVFKWTGSSATFRTTIVDAINQLVGSVVFGDITLEVEGDDEGMVIGIDPAVYHPTGSVNGEVMDFTLTFRGTATPSTEDTLHQLTLNVIGDGTVLLDSLKIYVVTPGVTL